MFTSSTDQIRELPKAELFQLCAVDPELYCHQFFPKAFRQASPGFHRDYWGKIEDPEMDFFGAEMFRGSGKTTLARAAISRRVAYGISRNILSVAISEAMAVNTVRWLKKQVENNTLWTTTFGLQPGKKWADDWIEVFHTIFGFSVNVIAKGMTSGLRGLNLDEWRPDFIYCDDICNEENTATPEQREKTAGLLFGALAPSLAPKTESPLRKLVLTQTALHKEDTISLAHRDPSWHTVRYPKVIYHTDKPPESAWPELYPIGEILLEKDAYTRRRQLHIWLREYECRLVSSETSAFDPAWLQFWRVLPTTMAVYIGIDPARSKQKSAHKTAISCIGIYGGNTYLLDYFAQTGKNPDEIWTRLVGMVRQWGPMLRKVGVESVAYQQMLAWYLRQKMQEHNFYFVIHEIDDRRRKPDRIRQALTGISANGKFYVSENHVDFLREFTEYSDGIDSDLLDSVAMAVSLANPYMINSFIEGEAEEIPMMDEKGIPELQWAGAAP